MLYTLAVILIVIWLLGLVSDFTGGGMIHLLLLLAAIMIVAQLIQGRYRRKNLKPKNANYKDIRSS
jgi:ammonia channel protein AmtB